MYPHFRYWAHIRKRLDPNRLFFNSYLDRIFSTFPTSTIATSDHNESKMFANVQGGDGSLDLSQSLH